MHLKSLGFFLFLGTEMPMILIDFGTIQKKIRLRRLKVLQDFANFHFEFQGIFHFLFNRFSNGNSEVFLF
jgi:hypothetical protein